MPPLWNARRIVFQRAAALLWVCAFGAAHVAQVATPGDPGAVRWDARLLARYLERSLSDEDAERAQRVFPEGRLFTWEFYALGLQNIAEMSGEPRDVVRANREAARVLPKIDAALMLEPFRTMRHWRLRGGVCWFSGQNWVRARMISLGGGDAADVERFHRDSQVLFEAFSASSTGVLEAYPGLTWPVDSLFGYASLAVHDKLYGTSYRQAFARYRRTVLAARDGRTGLVPSMLHLDGSARDVPRGCALSWSLAVLPSLDPELAADQWARYKTQFEVCRWGLCLFREYPSGRERPADVDSGPVAFGVGMSASGFALAAARANGDAQTVAALERTGNLLGLGAVSWWGERYLGGLLPSLDVYALWAKTLPGPAGRSAKPAYPVLLGLAAAWSLVCAAFTSRLRKAWLRLPGAGPSAAHRFPRQALLFGSSVLAALVHLAWPLVPALAVPVAWVAIGWLAGESKVGCPLPS